MNLRRSPSFWLLSAVCVVMVGCNREAAQKEAADKKERNQNLPSFKEGKGLFLPEDTRQSIGLEITDVTERNINRHLTIEVQGYDAVSEGVLWASGTVGNEQAEWLHPGQPVSLSSRGGQITRGRLARLDGQTQPVGQTEVIIEMAGTDSKPALGAFFTATLTATNNEAATAIPSSALLRSAHGDFVYVVNGQRLLRTAVKVGAEGDGFTQVTDGLYAGDKVAIKPVQMLWLTELRLANAGGDKD